MELIPSLNEIGAALAKAQAEMTNPTFDRENPHFRNKFASLAAVRNSVVPVLAKHGISVTQDLQNGTGGVSVLTILTHASGQQMRFGPLTMPVSKNDAQGFGSAATYARRYHLMSVCGVVGDEDDDANEAIGKPAPSVAVPANGKGIGIHSPYGDLDPAVADLATKYADAFRDALANGDVLAVANDMKEEVDEKGVPWGEVLQRSVWSQLDSKTRSAIKRIIEQRKAA